MLGIIKNPLRMTPEERVLDAYYDRLTRFPVEKSRVIVIDFLSRGSRACRAVANAIADAYLVRQQAAKQEQARAAGEWLAGEIEILRKKVADAEAKVEAFRANSNLLVGTNNTTLSAQQLGDLNAQLAAARAQKADAEAKAKLIREMLRSGEPIEFSDILNSELIRRLSEQRVTLRAQLAEQSSTLLGNHPRIKELKAQIADLDSRSGSEAERMARSFENDAKLAGARVDALTAILDQLKNQAASTNEQDVQLRALERDAKSQRDLLESYLAKYREATARDTIDSAPADARVISRATVSNVPAYPKKLPTVLIATLATFVLSLRLRADPRASWRRRCRLPLPCGRRSTTRRRRRLSARDADGRTLAAPPRRKDADAHRRRCGGGSGRSLDDVADALARRRRRRRRDRGVRRRAQGSDTTLDRASSSRARWPRRRASCWSVSVRPIAAIKAIVDRPTRQRACRTCAGRLVPRHHHQGQAVRPASDLVGARAGRPRARCCARRVGAEL